jgi:hypothetical protein
LKTVGAVLALSAVGLALFASNLLHAQSKEKTSLVHPAPASKTIAVTVTELRHAKHGEDQEVVIAQAIGFPNDTCDVITTFDVVKQYEERQTWLNIRQNVNIVVDGTSYPAQFRDFGFYPLGLNLACIDFVSPTDRAELQVPVLPLEVDPMDDPSSLSYDDREIVKSGPGTPFLNKNGEISSVLVATPNGPLEFASAEDIRRFLSIASSVSSGPLLRRRPLASI